MLIPRPFEEHRVEQYLGLSVSFLQEKQGLLKSHPFMVEVFLWEYPDLNRGPFRYERSALTKLRHIPLSPK